MGACALVSIVCAWVGVAKAAPTSGIARVPAPRFARTVDVAPVSGTITVLTPGGKARRLHVATQVPFGSILDTRHGTVRVTSANAHNSPIQTAEFNGGQIQLFQPKAEHGTVEVQLVGGNVASCKHSGPATEASGPFNRHVNTSGGYGGGYNTNGHSGSGRSSRHRGHATLAAAGPVEWDTVDTCAGTTIIAESGQVDTTGRGAPLRYALNSGDSVAYACTTANPVSCAAVHSTDQLVVVNGVTVHAPADDLTVLTRSPASTYDLTISGPALTRSATYPLTAPGGDGFRRSDLACVPDQGPGTYLVSWRVAGTLVGPLTYRAPASSPHVVPCTSTPYGRGIPSDLKQTQGSAHFLVHYSTIPMDPNATNAKAVATLLTNVERAYAYDTTTLGLPTFVDGGGNRIDIYVEATISPSGETVATPAAGASAVPAPGYPTAAYIVVRPSALTDPFATGEDVFFALNDAIGRMRGVEHDSLPDGAAYWASESLLHLSTSGPILGQPLDCDRSCPGGATYREWRFFQHLAERFGPTIVRDVLVADAAMIRAQRAPHMADALQQVLASHGSSLANDLALYVLEDLSESWQDSWVLGAGFSDSSSADSIALNALGQTFSTQTTVSHLAARYLRISIPPLEPCVTDTLALSTSTPVAGGIVPGASVYTGGRYQTAPASAASATAQTIQTTFDSCSGAIVRVPFVNGTTAVEAMPFALSGTLTRGS